MPEQFPLVVAAHQTIGKDTDFGRYLDRDLPSAASDPPVPESPLLTSGRSA